MTIKNKNKQKLLLLILLLLILSGFALASGEGQFDLKPISMILMQKASNFTKFIIFNIRLPRIIATLLGGGSLAISGKLLQTLSKNPLADSGILGINAGAGFMLALILSLDYFQAASYKIIIPIFAVFGALLTVMLVYYFAKSPNGYLNPQLLIITGVGFSTTLSALMIALMGKVNRFKMDYIVSWLSGQVNGDDWTSLLIVGPIILLLWSLIYLRARHLNILTLSDQSAISLGMDIKKEKTMVLWLATALAAISVTLVGNITFIGLLAGHLSQRLVGNDHRVSLPTSLFLGMIFLLLADTVCRVYLIGLNIPTGVVLSLIGAPYFLWILYRQAKKS